MAARSRRKHGLARWYRNGFLLNRHIDGFVLGALARTISPGDLLLDIGCGAQPFRSEIEGRGGRYIGLDFSTASHQRAAGLADATALPVRSGTVDVALCTELLEHVPDLTSAVAEIARVLRPGGSAVVTTPFMFGLHEQPFDFQRPTPHLLRKLLEGENLEVSEVQRLGTEAEVMATTWETFWNIRFASPSVIGRVVTFVMRSAGYLVATIARRVFMRSDNPVAYLTTGVVARKESPRRSS